MACCLCFFKASKKSYWPRIALPVFAATLSSAGFHIGVVLVLITMFLSTLFLFTFSKQKPTILDSTSLLLKENDCNQETEIDSEENGQGLFLIRSSEDDLYSSESASKSTTTSTNNNNSSSCEDKDEDKHSSSSSSSSSSSDQWPYYINSIKGQKKLEYCSDNEESLIEIAIPSEHFVISSPDLVQKRDYNINYDQQHMIKCCKLSAATDDHIMFHHKEDFLAADMINEEDSFIEIDIYMGSIKYCSTFS
ncbi:hypothetical protein ACP275_08G124900 [Erythranthe tilingii]